MRHKIVRAFALIACRVLSLATTPTNAQPDSSMDWTLSMLRGSWQFHTYDDKWTLRFVSDSRVFINNEGETYTILPGAFRIAKGDIQDEYLFQLVENSLTVTYPSGESITFQRDGSGKYEQLLEGRYYLMNDSAMYEGWGPSRPSFTFDGDRHFTAWLDTAQSDTSPVGSMVRCDGLYRVEGKRVILTYDDGTIDDAFISLYDFHGSVDGIVYGGDLYAKRVYAAAPCFPPYAFPSPPAHLHRGAHFPPPPFHSPKPPDRRPTPPIDRPLDQHEIERATPRPPTSNHV